MKSRRSIVITTIGVVMLGFIWWSSPVHFLKNVLPEEISHIEVFDGNTGYQFQIERPEEIEYIISNIQNREMRREKVSLGYMGTSYRLTFLDTQDRVVEEFIVNHAETIRKDPFFYTDASAGLCVDYLERLGERLVKGQ